MSQIRILFLGTADFAVPSLEALHKDEHYHVVQVISQKDKPAGRKLELKASPVKEKALALGLPVFTPDRIKSAESMEQIRLLKADVAVVIAYGQILSEEFLKMFPYGCVNVHGSLLPRWRGAAPIQRAIEAGDTVSGVCLQKMVYELDAGAVLGDRKVDISADMDAAELYEKLKWLAPELLHIELMDYIRGNLSGKAQDSNLVTIAPKILKEEGLIDWSKSSQQIYNQYRAFKIWPGVWTERSGKKLKIHSMQPSVGRGSPGSILSQDKESFVVACGQGALKVEEVQPDSKPRMKVKDFLNGFKLSDYF